TFGRKYIHDFNYLDRTWHVYMCDESANGESPRNHSELLVRSSSGEMIPLNAVVRVERTTGPDSVQRYNSRPAARSVGEPAPGYSTGEAMGALEEIQAELRERNEQYQLFWTCA